MARNLTCSYNANGLYLCIAPTRNIKDQIQDIASIPHQKVKANIREGFNGGATTSVEKCGPIPQTPSADLQGRVVVWYENCQAPSQFNFSVYIGPNTIFVVKKAFNNNQIVEQYFRTAATHIVLDKPFITNLFTSNTALASFNVKGITAGQPEATSKTFYGIDRMNLYSDNMLINYRPAIPAGLTGNSSNVTGQSYGNGTYVAYSNTGNNAALKEDAFLAFDKKPDTAWETWRWGYGGGKIHAYTWMNSTNGYGGDILQIQLPREIQLASYSFTCNNLHQSPKQWRIFGSKDGNTWVALDDRVNVTAMTAGSPWVQSAPSTFTVANNNNKFSFYRLITQASNGATEIRINDWTLTEVL